MSTSLDESNFKEYQESTTVTLEWTVRNLKQLFDASKGEQKSKVHKSVRFGGGRWQILLYPNSGHEGGYVSLYLSCEPTQEEKENAINGKWVRDGLFKFSFDLKTVNRASPGVFNTKEACDHAFSYKTANWGWAQFAKRDAVYYSAPQVRAADAFLIVCTITSSPVTPVQPPTAARQYVPKGLMDAVGSMLDDPLYSDVEFVIPSRKRLGKPKRIYANKKILSRAEYFDTMFQSGFSETSIAQDVASPPIGRRNSITDAEDDARSLEDSDESDAETETDQLDDFFNLHSPRRTTAGPPSRDATWETQSDVVVVRPGAREDEDMSDDGQRTATVGADVSMHGPVINLAEQGNANEEDVEMEKSQRPGTPRNTGQKTSHAAHSDMGSKREVQGPLPDPIPGPPKARVVVRDVAYATYFALLYYLYTDCINFAPLSSSFINAPGPIIRSANVTPGFGGLGPNAQSYFGSIAGTPGARPRSALTIGNTGAANSSTSADDEPPRTRKDWIKRWMTANPAKPSPVSAKAIYKLADKLGLADLKQRAFQHITRSLTVANIPYETFSSFSASYDEIRKVEIEFFLEKWSEIRNGEAMRTVFQQIRLGRHPGFEEIWPLIVQHLVFRPDADSGHRASPSLEIGTEAGRERNGGETF